MLQRRKNEDLEKDIKEFKSSHGIEIHEEEEGKHEVVVEDEDASNPDQFEVTDPIVGSHVTYTVKGYDDDGPFEGNRRYSDFYKLRNALLQRMPGVYVPPIPPKKMLGNKKDKFLDERKHFLQRFLQQCCRTPHIIRSDEFRLFSRPSGDIEKAIEALPPITPEFYLERFTTEFEFPEEENEQEAQENVALINAYQAFIKKILPILKTIRDNIKPMISERGTQNQNFNNMIHLMSKYEEGALLQYADNNASKLVVGNSLNPLYIETADDIMEKLKNPFIETYYWVKGEIYDIQALNDCIEGRNKMVKNLDKLEAKKKANDSNLDKLKSGRTTLSNIFSNATKKEQRMTEIANNIDHNDRDIELYTRVVNVIENHIAKEVIPKFKANKQKLYYKILQLVSVHEIHNCHLNLSFWQSIAKNKHIVNPENT